MKLRILATGAFELPTGVEWRLITGYDPHFAPQSIVQEACHRIRKRQGILFELPDGSQRALVRVFSPCLRLNQSQLVIASEAGDAYFVCISPASTSTSSEDVRVTRIEANAAGWNLGGATLTPWMLCGYPARPWTWAAPDTYGPFVLAIYVDRSAADLENWLNMFKPHGYVRKGHQDFHWNDDSGARLWIEEGRLMLTSQSSPQAARHAVDATLLGSVCDGDLGTELSWDFIDDDYRVYLATGHDLHSLREYVHARGPGLERFKAGQETVPCSGPRDLSALAARLRAKSLSELPRNVSIQLPPEILESWEQNPDVQAVLTSKSRIRFTLSAMKD